MNSTLHVHPDDNVLVALTDLKAGEEITFQGRVIRLKENIQAKHKFSTHFLAPGDPLTMYGVLVGKATQAIKEGAWIHTFNVKHAAAPVEVRDTKPSWTAPSVAEFEGLTFDGFHRPDGKVGTANYWVVIPLVFCENRNVGELRDALLTDLGYQSPSRFRPLTQYLIQSHAIQRVPSQSRDLPSPQDIAFTTSNRVFPQVDGIKFLTHDMGCGGTQDDAQALCALLAGYIAHPNVAGATVLSLGCQHAQQKMLQSELDKRMTPGTKPVYILEQQAFGTEEALLTQALHQTFLGLLEANQSTRKSAPLSELVVGLECGGSDGFSGLSANPAVGYAADLLVALGGTVVLSEFPELCGVEQELADRCISASLAHRFTDLMARYAARAEAVGSGFDMNPSPGNIRDGLITDAIKSAGAAKKGGTSPITGVLDYTEPIQTKGLQLLNTPGNDVESTTAEVASGATVVLFTTGLGTPTGNPIAPVIKVASNHALAKRMPDIIDISTGDIIEGTETIEAAGRRILKYVIEVASGRAIPAAVRLQQDDFIPWKRGVSL